MSQRLFISCGEPPVPPLNGNNRRVYELIRALKDEWEIQVLAYTPDEGTRRALETQMASWNVRLHRLERKLAGRHWRALSQGENPATALRDIDGEVELIRRNNTEPANARLLVDSVDAAKLAGRFESGVVISGPDCMSRQFGQVAKHARTFKERLRARYLQYCAANNERRWYHRADFAHTVSDMDKEAIQRVNPQARVEVITLGVDLPTAERLRPWSERRAGLIWGSLDFAPARQGVQLLAKELRRAGVRWEGWSLLGKVPEARALELVPELSELGIRYLEWCDDITGLLAKSRFVICPDVGGAGQKNRALDGLAHGCVTVGLAEAFRDLRGESGRHYVQADSLAGIAPALDRLDEARLAEIAHDGRELIRAHFSHEALARSWNELFARCGPLRPNRARN